MIPLTYERAATPEEAAAAAARTPGAKFIAGGTNLLDLMKLQIEKPTHLIDVNRLGLDEVEERPDGTLEVGALVRNTDLAAHPTVRRDYPVLARAILAGASGQLRNRATTAGNLLQRTRCGYFYDPGQPCNKRTPGAGCAAMGGVHRQHAILGASAHCIATNPSDMNVALRALDATVNVMGANGAKRRLPIADLHRLPEDRPDLDTTLAPGELITSVTLPRPVGGTQIYRKVRDRSSYAFAIVSVAAIVEKKEGAPARARVAFGGLAHKPWRVEAAEAALTEGASGEDVADVALRGAKTTKQTAYKIELTRATLASVLRAI